MLNFPGQFPRACLKIFYTPAVAGPPVPQHLVYATRRGRVAVMGLVPPTVLTRPSAAWLACRLKVLARVGSDLRWRLGSDLASPPCGRRGTPACAPLSRLCFAMPWRWFLQACLWPVKDAKGDVRPHAARPTAPRVTFHTLGATQRPHPRADAGAPAPANVLGSPRDEVGVARRGVCKLRGNSIGKRQVLR
jgi:hypothetical protein